MTDGATKLPGYTDQLLIRANMNELCVSEERNTDLNNVLRSIVQHFA